MTGSAHPHSKLHQTATIPLDLIGTQDLRRVTLHILNLPYPVKTHREFPRLAPDPFLPARHQYRTLGCVRRHALSLMRLRLIAQ